MSTLKYVIRIEDAQGVLAVAVVESPDSSGVCTVSIAERGGKRRRAECWPGGSWVQTVANALRACSAKTARERAEAPRGPG